MRATRTTIVILTAGVAALAWATYARAADRPPPCSRGVNTNLAVPQSLIYAPDQAASIQSSVKTLVQLAMQQQAA